MEKLMIKYRMLVMFHIVNYAMPSTIRKVASPTTQKNHTLKTGFIVGFTTLLGHNCSTVPNVDLWRILTWTSASALVLGHIERKNRTSVMYSLTGNKGRGLDCLKLTSKQMYPIPLAPVLGSNNSTTVHQRSVHFPAPFKHKSPVWKTGVTGARGFWPNQHFQLQRVMDFSTLAVFC